jgi:hypothetical protein
MAKGYAACSARLLSEMHNFPHYAADIFISCTSSASYEICRALQANMKFIIRSVIFAAEEKADTCYLYKLYLIFTLEGNSFHAPLAAIEASLCCR